MRVNTAYAISFSVAFSVSLCFRWRVLQEKRRKFYPVRTSLRGIGEISRNVTKEAQVIEVLWLSRDEVRQIDAAAIEELGLPGVVLMENAARGVSDLIRGEGLTNGRVILLCGPGNNGGDGFALARQLTAHDLPADVWLTTNGRQLTVDTEFNRRVWLASGHSVKNGDDIHALQAMLTELQSGDLVVDCLLGTGIRGAVREPYSEIIAAANASAASILAVDVPSGMDCESGASAGECIRAERTVTFVGMKTGFRNPAAQSFLGKTTVAHIGLPQNWIRNWLHRYRLSGETLG